MSGKEWDVNVTGVVTRIEDKARVSVARGAYRMREVGRGEYELSREGSPTFRLSLREVSQYKDTKSLKITGTWP
jgi:hypothetical protein